ncbi:methyltransferase [Deinococcus malanensis]|uniref:Methyltransferase n=1 Tax=Deinococcus malanensis TaxID=1706855 RepID=A0ABQ2F125_9DEIO|nr:methyltransferase domain-containing protein [Deinococcus malanensis]GGK37358.1 methyltransferase [Deinococcus malanensis]
MLPEDQARHNAARFDRLATTYDQLGFLALAARELARQLRVEPGQAVLDVASGTGTVALELASRVGTSGRVVGTDLAPRMVAQARSKAQGIPQLSFELADASALPFPDATFDRVICASGLFFMPDMVQALREWRRVVRPGGLVAFSSFGPGLLGELPALWREELTASGLKPAPPPLGRLPSVEAARELLQQVSFQDAQVSLEPLSYTLSSPEARWADITAGLEGDPVSALSAEALARLRRAHLSRLREAVPSWPLTVPVPVIVAIAVR